MGYVIIHKITGRYVATPGSEHSYTSKLENARRFRTREAAEKEVCLECEQVFAIESCLMRLS